MFADVSTLLILVLAMGSSFMGCTYIRGELHLDFLPGSLPGFLRTISTFGVMLVAAFLAGNYIIQKEFKRLNIDRKIGDNIVILALVGGIAGSKLFFLFEVHDSIKSTSDIMYFIFQGAGLVWYGGLIVAGGMITWYIKKMGFDFFYLADILTPVIALGHGIGRLGCWFSGDGCYGTVCPFNWPAPFAMSFENGAAPWGTIIGQIARETGQVLDPATAVVYNTPFFEAIIGISLFVFYYKLRKKEWPHGFKFISFIMIHVTFRFFIEFIRLNRFEFFGLFTQAQLLGLIAFIAGIGFFIYRRRELKAWITGSAKPA